ANGIMTKQESPASSVTDFPSFFSTPDDPGVAGHVARNVEQPLFAVVLLDQPRLVERVEENCFEFGDLVLRDAELVDQGVIEELHVRQVLAAVVAIDRRNIRGLRTASRSPTSSSSSFCGRRIFFASSDTAMRPTDKRSSNPNFRAELSSSA